MDGIGRTQDAAEADGQTVVAPRLSRFSKLRLWLAGYSALELVTARDNDHLSRDAGLSREEARDSLRAWRIIGFLLWPRSGRE